MCAGGAGPAQLRQFSTKQLSLQLQRSMSITADGRLVPDATWAQQQAEQQKMGTAEVLGCEQEFQQEVSCCCLLLPRALPPPSVVGWSVHPHAAGMAAVCLARQLQFTLVSPSPSILALQAQCALSESTSGSAVSNPAQVRSQSTDGPTCVSVCRLHCRWNTSPPLSSTTSHWPCCSGTTGQACCCSSSSRQPMEQPSIPSSLTSPPICLRSSTFPPATHCGRCLSVWCCLQWRCPFLDTTFLTARWGAEAWLLVMLVGWLAGTSCWLRSLLRMRQVVLCLPVGYCHWS